MKEGWDGQIDERGHPHDLALEKGGTKPATIRVLTGRLQKARRDHECKERQKGRSLPH